MNIHLLKGTQHFPFVKTGMLSNTGTLPKRGFWEKKKILFREKKKIIDSSDDLGFDLK